jgi:ubiquinone biosynthesis protein COQ4
MEPVTPFEPRRAITALGRLLRDPDDLPQVFTIIQALSGRTPERLLARLKKMPAGAALLRSRRDIVPLLSDREGLRRMPDDSLGRAYLDFVESEGISADGIVDASMRGFEERELSDEHFWLQQRMRDTHDLWHAVTGYKGDVLGEAAILAFLFAQTFNPGIGAILALSFILLARKPGAWRLIFSGFMRGRRAAWLPGVDWESLLTRPLTEVRAALKLDGPPSYTVVRSAQIRAERAGLSVA